MNKIGKRGMKLETEGRRKDGGTRRKKGGKKWLEKRMNT